MVGCTRCSWSQVSAFSCHLYPVLQALVVPPVSATDLLIPPNWRPTAPGVSKRSRWWRSSVKSSSMPFSCGYWWWSAMISGTLTPSSSRIISSRSLWPRARLDLLIWTMYVYGDRYWGGILFITSVWFRTCFVNRYVKIRNGNEPII